MTNYNPPANASPPQIVVSFVAVRRALHMTQKWMAASALCLAVILASCEKPAPPDTREADAKAIRELEDNWSKVMGARDAAKFVTYYAADASAFFPGAPAMHGTDAILKGLRTAFEDPNFSSSFKTSRVHVARSGDLACSEGTFEQTVTDPASKKKVAEKGNYVTCWTKQPGAGWKAISDMAMVEPSAPPPAARKAAKPKKHRSRR
jgi:uncharacterized protein (TIGR02246 family)